MIVLAIDTAANLCAACAYDSERDVQLGGVVIDLGTGHAERLMGMIADTLAQAELEYSNLGAVAVSIGPGSFTGVRVGVATARGLALALKVPAIGVTTLEAVAEEARSAFPGRPVLAAIDARRNEIYAAYFGSDGSLHAGPMVTTVVEMARAAAEAEPVLAGSAAALISAHVSEKAGTEVRFDIASPTATADILTYARLSAHQGPVQERPKPLYLRGADAKPQAGFALPRKAG